MQKKIIDIVAENTKEHFSENRIIKEKKGFRSIYIIFLIAVLILLAINTVNVYFKSKIIKDEIELKAKDSYSLLLNAGKNSTFFEYENAKLAIQETINNLVSTKTVLWFYDSDKTIYSEKDSYSKSIKNMLLAGENFLSAATLFLDSLEDFNKIPLIFVVKNKDKDQKLDSLSSIVDDGLKKVSDAISNIALAYQNISEIDESILNDDLKLKLSLFKTNLEQLSNTLNLAQKFFPAILKLMGDKHPHRYMIIFQNNHELRPSGGFIGSYAILDIDDGYIEKLETHDVYDIDGSYGEYIEPPEEFKKFTSNWRMRDANYSHDFPSSAKKIMWFYEKEGGPSVDTIIAINQGLLNDLLEITGPIQVGDFAEFNSENYNILLSYIIESKYWGAQDPKHVLKIFVDAFKDEIMDEKYISKVSSKLYKAIRQKHIMMYSKDEEIQNMFSSLKISGEVDLPGDNTDYLAVINTSTGGTKSDKFIEERIQHDTKIQADGQIIDTVTITRKHSFTDDVYYYWRNILIANGIVNLDDQVIDIMGRGRNRTNVRVYVPKGSTLISSNKEIEKIYDIDLDLEYFLFEIEITAGQQDTARLTYSLPFSVDEDAESFVYKLDIDKQPGNPGAIFTKNFKSENLKIIATYPSALNITPFNNVKYASDLVYDRYFSALIQDKN